MAGAKEGGEGGQRTGGMPEAGSEGPMEKDSLGSGREGGREEEEVVEVVVVLEEEEVEEEEEEEEEWWACS